MRIVAKIVLWVFVAYAMTIGLQACKTQPKSRSKFDTKPQHDHFEKRHRRWN